MKHPSHFDLLPDWREFAAFQPHVLLFCATTLRRANRETA